MQKIILGVLAVLAVAGWAAAYVFYTESGDLTERLASVEAERTTTAAALDLAQSDLKKQVDSTARLEKIEQQSEAAEAKLAVIEKQLQSKQSDLTAMYTQIESGKLEISKMERQIKERTASFETAEQEAERARLEVEKLRAEVTDLAQTTERLRTEPPPTDAPSASGATVARAATTAELDTQPGGTKAQTTDPRGRTEKVFQILDKNGDGAIDELEFRLNSVRLLGLIDTNADGFITPDETLLPPERFALFDQDGDGKISSVEFVEAFQILDGGSKGSITVEDYQKFIKSAAK